MAVTKSKLLWNFKLAGIAMLSLATAFLAAQNLYERRVEIPEHDRAVAKLFAQLQLDGHKTVAWVMKSVYYSPLSSNEKLDGDSANLVMRYVGHASYKNREELIKEGIKRADHQLISGICIGASDTKMPHTAIWANSMQDFAATYRLQCFKYRKGQFVPDQNADYVARPVGSYTPKVFVKVYG